MNYFERTAKRLTLINIIAEVAIWFASAGFIMWGWNTLAPHINCPTFSYMEIFAMRMGLYFVMRSLLPIKAKA